MKTLFIHVGTPKTGTTAIQHFCKDNAKVLEKMGYCYPKATKKYPSVSLVRNGHFLSGYVHGEKPDINENKRIIEAGMNKVKELFQKHDNIILSDESIWRTSSSEHDFLWELLSGFAKRDGYKIKVVVYLRRQDDYIMSIWNQMVKYSDEKSSWDEYYNRRKDSKVFKYYEKLQEIEKWFGKENVIVRRFDRDSFVDGSIFCDFLFAIGLEWSDIYKIKKQKPNTNLSGNAHEIQRLINLIDFIGIDEKRYLSKLVQQCPLPSKEEYKFSMMSKQERIEFLDMFRAGNEKIAEEYIGDGKPMYNYDVPDMLKWENDNSYLKDDLLCFNAYVAKEFCRFSRELNEMKHKVEVYNRIMHPINTLRKYFAGK